MFAKVAVDIKNDNLNNSFDYEIPSNLTDYINVGSRVLVSFGAQDILGYVVEIMDKTSYQKGIKQIKDVLDYDQELTTEQIDLAKMMSKYYLTSLSSNLDLMIPSFLKGKKRKWLVVNDYNNLHPTLYELFKGKARIAIDNKILENYSLIKKEINKGNITLDYDFFSYGKNKKQKLYYVDQVINNISEKRKKIIDLLIDYPSSSLDFIIKNINYSEYLIKKMVKEGQIKEKEEAKLLVTTPTKFINKGYEFTFDQMQTLERFDNSRFNNFLLFSNDEEFKTNFYLHVIEQNAKQNLPTIFITPTIFISEELILFLKKNLSGYRILSYTSKNSQGDNYDTYMNVKYNNFDILVATVSGIFLPFKEMGSVIMIDEENSFYLNENYPFYDTVDVLSYRCKQFNSKLILTSSSPSINNYYASEIGKFELITSGSLKLGNVQVIDMKEELLKSSDRIFSNTLKLAIKDALDNNKQVMILANNKAYSTVIKCRSCGSILKCPTCGIPLTLFKEKNFAKCTYCDTKVYDYGTCPKCGSKTISTYGFGLEQIKESLGNIFSAAKIIQVDSESMKNLDYYEDAISKIEDGSVDIIIGTSILTKYINNTNIGLIAYLTIDRLLNLNDYRANEQAYNSIAKIINNENVIIQTFNPNNDIIKYASSGNYDKYFDEEIIRRKEYNYSPFYDVSKITIIGEYKEMYHFANYYRKVYKKMINEFILGPTYDYKCRGVKLIIKYNDYDKVIKILNDSKKEFEDKKLVISFERKPKVL